MNTQTLNDMVWWRKDTSQKGTDDFESKIPTNEPLQEYKKIVSCFVEIPVWYGGPSEGDGEVLLRLTVGRSFP